MQDKDTLKSEKPFKGKAKKKVKIFKSRKKGHNSEQDLIENLKKQYEELDLDAVTKFSDLPLSPPTMKGLKECGYKIMTDIQKETIKLSLMGKDILGAAQTGSGKTLAFLIPILERLFCNQWTNLDGLGALVITPTRELAYQIFETLRTVGQFHDFSAGLIIGGKDLKFERGRMDQCNIIICTPGRLLQHMDENPLFDCVNLQVLVLDEADRCLDMGFEATMNAIIANLPLKRQTLLFSATQTKSVKDLSRLSLKDPCYVSVHEHATHSTPQGLQQSYAVCELENKISIIWSFIRNHVKQKTIIFLASCKQVKYYYEMFCKLRPGVSLLALYGTLHQLRRMEIYETFRKKSAAVLFATDIAARGLDFPDVHWVVQGDCPEDVATYIHRVGRTARYCKGGESLLLLLSPEVPIVEELKSHKIPVEKIDINPEKINNPLKKMEAFLSKDPNLEATAQRAFMSYIKSVYLMKNKKIFDAFALNMTTFAYSLGLKDVPRLRFLQRAKKRMSLPTQNTGTNEDIDKEESETELNYCVESIKPTNNRMVSLVGLPSDDEDDDLLGNKKSVVITRNSAVQKETIIEPKVKKSKAITKAALVKKALKKQIVPNKKITFDDEGEAIANNVTQKKSELAQSFENVDEGGIDIEKAKLVLKEEDKFDSKLFKDKVKAKHKEEKRKMKEEKEKQKEVEADEFGEASGSDYEPDLTWLPDPDKIYGPNSDNEEDEVEDKQMDILEDEQEVEILSKKEKSKKRKRKNKLNDGNVKKRKGEKLKEISSSLNVDETEELALLLLKNK